MPQDPAVINAQDLAMVESSFKYHAPHGDQAQRYERIRTAAGDFAKLLIAQVPPCADRTAAIRKLRECVMTANAAIAIQEAQS